MTEVPTFSGHCYCGALSYTVTGKPMGKAQCHCRECQYISGGGPNYFMVLPQIGFVWTTGSPQTFTRTDIDGAVTRCFCGTCGTHITSQLPDGLRTVLKVGTLDDPSVYKGPKAAIYTVDQQPFHEIPSDLPCFEGLP